jgi:hypothetical protein
MSEREESRLTAALVIGSALLLSLFTVFLHAKAMGRAYVETHQVPRHLALLSGTAGNPWQYRVFSAWVVEGVHRAFDGLHVPDSLVAAFLAVRIGQEILMFVVAWAYWRALGIATHPALLGMAILGWSVSYGNYGSDFQFNTYFDVLFYVLAGLAVVRGRWGWVVPITLLAALNRETSGFIPLLPLAAAWRAAPEVRTRAIRVAAIALAVYGVTFVALRWAYGRQDLIIPYGHRPGLDLLGYNLSHARTWVQLAGTLSIVPIVALLSYRSWPRTLRAFGWMLVPAWFAIHWVIAVMSETRLLLVPMALVLVPGALLPFGALQPTDEAARVPGPGAAAA